MTAAENGRDDVPGTDLRAAEYVLGTLPAAEAHAVAQARATDPALDAAVAEWERRLGPLARLAPAEAPPPGLWARIEAAVAPPPLPAPLPDTSGNGPQRWLRWWAGLATVAAVAMAALLLRPAPATQPMMTVMLADRTQPAWAARVDPDGAIHLAAIPPAAAGTVAAAEPEGRVRQLWALPPGATAPTSLALLPRGGTVLRVPAPPVRPVPGMLIEITLEPEGGSPTGRPTGPVLFIGRLSQPGPDS